MPNRFERQGKLETNEIPSQMLHDCLCQSKKETRHLNGTPIQLKHSENPRTSENESSEIPHTQHNTTRSFYIRSKQWIIQYKYLYCNTGDA